MNEIIWSQTESIEAPIITVTQAALDKINEFYRMEDPAPAGLRIGVKGGGCSGLLYVLEFIDESEMDPEEDIVYKNDPCPIVIDVFSKLYLVGTTLGYVVGLKESGFKFSNPSLKKTCGCGSSFSA